jgi:hypothetical protein
MNDELGDRVVYSPRGRNAEDDLAACILQATHIFMMDGQLVWITDGKRVPVFRDVMIELCRRFVVTEHPVERDGKWVVELRPFVPDELMVRNLIRESLPKRVTVVRPEAAPALAPEAPGLPDDHPEVAAGRRQLARHAEQGNSRLQEELEAGRMATARYSQNPQA